MQIVCSEKLLPMKDHKYYKKRCDPILLVLFLTKKTMIKNGIMGMRVCFNGFFCFKLRIDQKGIIRWLGWAKLWRVLF